MRAFTRTLIASAVAVSSGIGAASLLAQAPAAPAGRGQAPAQPAGRGQAPGGGRGQAGGWRGVSPLGQEPPPAAAPSDTPIMVDGIPVLNGMWNGGGGVRPVNSETVPWMKDNFPELNERGLAHQKAFDEAIAPKYDCVPSTSPAIQYDPYSMQVVQWPDRVIFRYEKDDQTRTVWLDGRKPTVNDWSLQGFSTGKYENGALIVHTDHFVFDVTGFDDYNGIPSSQMKKITEKYWRDGNELRLTLTLEDPMFLKKPTGYTTRWLPQRPGYQLAAWDCDPETSRAPVRMMVPKYK